MTADEMRISDWSSDVCSSDLFFAIFGTGADVGKAGIVREFGLPDILEEGPPLRIIVGKKADPAIGRFERPARSGHDAGIDHRRGGRRKMRAIEMFDEVEGGHCLEQDRKSTRLNSSH